MPLVHADEPKRGGEQSSRSLRSGAGRGIQVEVAREIPWRRIVRCRLHSLDWDRLRTDVEPFLEPGAETGLMTRENLELVLAKER